VTNGNKHDFILKKSHFIGYKCVKEQVNNIVEGFHKVIPQEWVKVFTSDELEAAICGQQQIHLPDWRANTEVKGFRLASMTVKNFWAAMDTYN
jgi:hypothetical protein